MSLFAALGTLIQGRVLPFFSLAFLAVTNPQETQFPEVQTWVNRLIGLGKIVGGGVITLSLIIAVLMIVTSLGGERRKAVAIGALLFVLLGAALFFGMSIVEVMIKRVVQ